MSEEPLMVEELRMVRRPADTHRPTSRSDPNYEREMAFDDAGNLRTIPEGRQPTEVEVLDELGYSPCAVRAETGEAEKRDTLDDILRLVEFGAEFTVFYLERIHPHVQRMLAERKARRAAKLSGRRYVEAGPAVQRQPEPAPTVVVPAELVDQVAVPDEQVVMTRQVFGRTLLFTLAAQRWADQGRDILAQATVADEPLTPALQVAMNLALSGNADQLDGEMTALLAAFFCEVGVLDGDGQLAPAISPAVDGQAAVR